jgi:hypothetical protein
MKNVELERGVSKKVSDFSLAEDEILVATDKQINSVEEVSDEIFNRFEQINKDKLGVLID